MQSNLRRKGFEVGPGVVLVARRAPEGHWAVWAEFEGCPIGPEGHPRLFEGATRFQAQCDAIRWLEANGWCQIHEAETSLSG